MHRREGGAVGQATVEVALVLPLILLLVLFVVQTGLVVRDEVLTVHAAREGARAAAVVDTDRAGAAAAAARTAGPLDPSRLGVRIEELGDGYVRVEVTYDDPTDLVLVGPLLPSVHHRVSATMRVEPSRSG